MLSRRGRSALVAGLGAMRLAEVVWSSRNLRRTGAGRQAAPRSFPLMVSVNVALFTLCIVPRRRRPPRALEVAALTGLAAAVGLRLWVIGSLGPAWNVKALVPEEMTVVTRGPYRWMRHPNYLAVIVEFACLPVAVGAYSEAVLLSAANAAVLVPRIRAEEALLDQVPGYREAFAGVPRLLPTRLSPAADAERVRWIQIPARESQSRGESRPKPQ
jgi:methyltransferase